MTSKAGRAAFAIKSGTVAAGMAVGNTLAYVAPQLAGAIDIVVVKQPDGTLKSSPFYVRFGKYTGLRSDPNKVAIFVNDQEVDFCMHMGRTGEAYFIVDAEPGDQAQFAEALNGLMSPVSGYSSDQEPATLATEQPANASKGLQDSALKNAASTPVPAKEPVRPRPGPEVTRGRVEELDSTLSAPASLEGPEVAGAIRALAGIDPPRPMSEAGEGRWGRSRPPQQLAPAGTSLERIRNWNVESLEHRAALQSEHRTQGAAGSLGDGSPSHGNEQEPGRSSLLQPASPPGGKFTFSPRSSSSSLLMEEGMFSPLRAGQSGASSPQSGGSPGHMPWLQHWDGRGSPCPGLPPSATQIPSRLPGDCPAVMRSASRPPQHPWSVGNPRLLPSPLAAQPQPAIMSSADAATPVHGAAAGQGHLEAGATAILPRRSMDEAMEPGRPRHGGRVELEALEHRVGRAHQPAPLAVAGVAHEVDRWHNEGGHHMPPQPGMAVAEAIDHFAEQHAAEPSLNQQPSGLVTATGAHLNQNGNGFRSSHQKGAPVSIHGIGETANGRDGPMLESAFLEAARGGSPGSGEVGQGWRVPGEQSDMPPLPDRVTGFGSAIELSAGWHEEREAGGQRLRAAAAPLEAFAEEEASSQSRVPLDPAPEESPVSLGIQGRASQASEAASSSLPIGIPGHSSGSERYTETWASERPLGGSLPAGAFGMSPTESAKYLGNASERRDERLVIGGLQDVELSLCASSLQPGMSPQEAWVAFEAGRINRAQYEAQGLELVDSPELVCRLGKRLLPWRLAAPVLLGMAAFGCQLEALDAGVPVEVPQQLAGETKKEAEKRSGWRVWLKSWRSRRESDASGIEPAAPSEAASQREIEAPEAPKQEVKEEPLAMPETETMLEAGKRVPGKRRGFCPSSKQLRSLRLNEGQNTIDFVYGKQRLSAYLYYFHWNARLVISDVDGTITRSDLLGHVLPRVGFDWSHPGINRFFSHIEKNGYHILFLSSRAIAQASATRDYLHSLNQDGHKLPCGPVIISPDGLFPSLYRELVLRRPHEFKIRALEDIRALFPPTWNPFFCGFGNRDTDEISYLTVGVPASKIFIINPKGELRQASSAVVTSTWNSLTRIVDIVNEIFPPCEPRESPEASLATPQREEFSDYNYWHVAPPIIVDSDDEVFGDPDLKGLGDSEEEETEDEDDDDSVAEATPVGFRAWP